MARQAASEGEALLAEAVAAMARVAHALEDASDAGATDSSNITPIP